MENGIIRRNIYFWGRVALLVLAIVLALALIAARAEIVDSGTCGANGDNLTWTLDDEGTLIISGIGNMKDYSSSSIPWGNSIKQVNIEDSVSSIGRYAFYNCSNLTSIIIPDSVTSIGYDAFYHCNNLNDLYISSIESWLSISFGDDYYSYPNCYAKNWYINDTPVTSIEVPEGMTSIGNSAFRNCSSLMSIKIPNSVTSIGESAFSYCSSLIDISIPDVVTSIGNSAFNNCKNLTRIIIPDDVTVIGTSTFNNCTNLVNIAISERVTSIGLAAFSYCSSLTNITIPASVTSISDYAFMGCSNLTSIVIPSRVTSIGNRVFSGCTKLTNISIPDGLSSIGSFAFYDCSRLNNIYIPESVVTLGDNILKSFKGTIYCHEFSVADYWATEKGYKVVYVDNIDIESIRTLALPGNFRLACGETRKLVADVFPNYDHPVVTWASSVPEFVSVEDGLVTAIAPGAAVITAILGNKTASAMVKTFAPLQEFDMPAEVWIVAKKTLQLVPENVIPAGAEGDFTWVMADTSIATVDETGLVSGRKPGDTTLTVIEIGTGIVRSTLVHVCFPVDAISLDPETVSLIQGQSFQLTANVTAQTQVFVNKLVTFSSSDEAVATVDKDGSVTAHALGTATITATAESGVSATCTVIVFNYVTTLPADLTAIEEEAFTGDLSLEYVIIPEGCQSIGPRAFAGCANLLYVLIPADTTIASDAFEGCDQVTIDIVD